MWPSEACARTLRAHARLGGGDQLIPLAPPARAITVMAAGIPVGNQLLPPIRVVVDDDHDDSSPSTGRTSGACRLQLALSDPLRLSAQLRRLRRSRRSRRLHPLLQSDRLARLARGDHRSVRSALLDRSDP